jgi:hypothetical protein
MNTIRITSKREGFRRAGIAHSTKPTDHPAKNFTKEQIAALKAESMLAVEELDVAETKPKASDKDKK